MKKRVLFIDRDGTLIEEPPVDFQVDSFEKLRFIPGAILTMHQIARTLDFELVMVTNQDGLGTPSFPEESFWPVHNLVMDTFKGEGVVFDAVCIDRSFPEDQLPTRKPGTKMLERYFSQEYDLAGSYVIGDRITDMQLAKNLGAKGILLSDDSGRALLEKEGLSSYCSLIASDWNTIYTYLRSGLRTAKVERKTAETQILIRLDLDGEGETRISTGLGFFDHMLEQIARHSGMSLFVEVKGDLQVDEHHTIEDTGLALGEALKIALGDKRGIERYGYVLPMDDCRAAVALDFGGRPWLVWKVDFTRERVGEVPTEMFFHFFKSLTDTAQMNLNVQAEGDNDHHRIEGVFKAFARALKMAVQRDVFRYELPSTKGTL
jgi:imidazoleglycerol-phosphate dehydratase/histidinol-phosphatase